MNLPNKLSMIRIIAIPLVMLFMLPISIYGFSPDGWNNFISSYGMIVAGIIFVIASLTDFADGYIARKYNLITDLGKFLDALADKMLVISILLAFIELGRISAWPVMIICLREFMVTGIRLIASKDGVVMAAKMLGKIKTTTQMIAITFLMFEFVFIKLGLAATTVTIIGDILFYISVIMTIVSGMDYLLKNLHYFKESK